MQYIKSWSRKSGTSYRTQGGKLRLGTTYKLRFLYVCVCAVAYASTST